MLLLGYNILQLLFLVTCWPLLILLILTKAKYRERIPARLGAGLSRRIPPHLSRKTFWLHALSVGEVTSALPLATAIRKNWPTSRIVVTVTTASGEKIARDLLDKTVDTVLPAPLDLRFVVRKYIDTIRPDVYIHVETDFWPNLLSTLKTRSIPSLLVNGRVSERSLASYRRYAFFFSPMFKNFSELSMQTAQDRKNMESLGVPVERIHSLGNLKFDTPAAGRTTNELIGHLLPRDTSILVAGSTHPGEEKVIIDSFLRLLERFPQLFLVIVPRNIDRAEEIRALASAANLDVQLRTASIRPANLLVVDTIGELIDFYRFATVAFVGGSLVPSGGHNPIEPALFGIPVLFGPHMEDFSEIADSLLACGGGRSVDSTSQLETAVTELLTDHQLHKRTGAAALACIEAQRGVIESHLKLLQRLL